MEYQYEGERRVSIEREGQDFRITVGDRVYAVQVNRSSAEELTFTVAGKRYHAYLAQDGARRYVAFDATVYTLAKTEASRKGQRKHAAGHSEDSLAAAMPGQVVNVLVKEGDRVVRGQALMVLEAMKMEIRVAAPHDGLVAKVHCQKGEIVERGQTLIELTEG